MQRENWVDIVKVISMMMVVFTHINQNDFTAVQYVSMFHVPVFFIASGYLYKTNVNFWSNAKKLFVSLAIPYFLLNIACVLYEICFYPKADVFSIYNHIWMPIRKVLFAETGLPLVGPMWFVTTLFFTRLTIDAVMCTTQEKHKEKVMLSMLGLSVISAYFISKSFEATSVYSILIVPMSMPFFILGYILKKNGIIGKLKGSRKSSLFLATICGVLTYIMFQLNGGANMSLLAYGENYAYFYVSAIAGSMMIILLSIQLNNINFYILAKLCRGMLAIVAWHYIAMDLVFKRMLHIYEMPVVLAAITAIFVVIAFYPLIGLLEKYAPIVIGNRK